MMAGSRVIVDIVTRCWVTWKSGKVVLVEEEIE
jgi:hypothetical protein